MNKHRLAEIRKAQGVSQLALAKVTNIAPSDISRIENRRLLAYPAWRRRIARALGVPEAEIWPLEDLRG